MKLTITLSDPFDLSKIDENGTEINFIATAKELEGVKETLQIERLSKLEGVATIKPWHKTGFIVAGTLRASAVQICVVTLEPVAEEVSEPFERTFIPPEEAAEEEPDEDVATEFILEVEDPPDILEGHTLDLLSLISEHLALGLDPYPRKPDARIDAAYQLSKEEEDKENPFSVLKQLKK
jgi:uncharacterized metal-binding protein YceD (DUF177 family)